VFLEVDHGPFLFDNNIFLSPTSIGIQSQGGAFVHNLFAGTFHLSPPDKRLTPFHKPHSTEIAGFHDNPAGDVRIYNNIFVKAADLTAYDTGPLPVWMEGNVFVWGAKPGAGEKGAMVDATFDPNLRLVEDNGTFTLNITLDQKWLAQQKHRLVNTSSLGSAAIPRMRFEQPDGRLIRIDTDYFGVKRNMANPFPGPFEFRGGERRAFPVGH
jgi:alpha-N-arabinofuranosidase